MIPPTETDISRDKCPDSQPIGVQWFARRANTADFQSIFGSHLFRREVTMFSRFALFVALLYLFLANNHTAVGSTFEFDITDSAREFPLETPVDLGTSFRSVDQASVRIEGIFTPGLATGVTLPPLSGPVIPSDSVNLIVRLGEVGTTWADKQTYAIQDLQGMTGEILLNLSLRATSPPTALLTFLPSGDLEPDFGFLLDGKFELSFSSMHWLAYNLLTLQAPQFELTRFVLHVEGLAVPEPTGLALVAIVPLLLIRMKPLRLQLSSL
jgi:hypothetical protein